MATNSQKITQMIPAATPLTGAELVPIVQGGVNKAALVSEFGATNQLQYQGTWNASTNTPTITSSVGTTGYYYIVSVAGTTTINGISSWSPGDWIIFSNTGVWQKIGGGAQSSLLVQDDTNSGTTYNLTFTTVKNGYMSTIYVDDAELTFKTGVGHGAGSNSGLTAPATRVNGYLTIADTPTTNNWFAFENYGSSNGGTLTMYSPGDAGSGGTEAVAWNKYGWLGIGIDGNYDVWAPLMISNTIGGSSYQILVTDSPGSNTVGLKIGYASGNASLTSDGILTFATSSTKQVTINTAGALGFGVGPSYGTAGQVLVSQGSVALPQWENPSSIAALNIYSDSSSNTAYNIAMTSSAGGTISTEYVDSGVLTFNPSTGRVTSPTFVANAAYPKPAFLIRDTSAGDFCFYDNINPDLGIYNYHLYFDSGLAGIYMSTVNTEDDIGKPVIQLNQYGGVSFGDVSGNASGFGTAGQVLTSQGNGAHASWGPVAGGGF